MTIHIRRATPRPSTVDLEARTVEAVASAFAPVVRPGFVERLDPAGMDLSRLAGAPVLDGHRQESTRDVLGVVEEGRNEPGEGLVVKLRFRDNAAARAVLADIADGTIRGLSVGYSVGRWTETRDGQTLIRTATRWTPVEISIVPVPADPAAHFRAAKGGPIMAEETIEAPAPAPVEAPVMTRAQINVEIRSIAETAGLGRSWADAQVDAEATVEEARAAAFEAMRTRRSATTTRTARAEIVADHTDPAVIATRGGEALWSRMHPEHNLSPEARPWRYMTPTEMARDCLRRSGQSVSGIAPERLVTRALETTSDYPAMLGDALRRELRAGYELPQGGVRQLARQTTAQDFRQKRVLRLGELDTLEKVNEHGEFKTGTLPETEETYKVETFGRIIGLTRQVLVNDDLGMQMQLANRRGRAARAFEHEKLAQLVEANPLMSDGVAVFDASAHGNTKAAAGAALADIKADLGAARLGMRKQTAPGGALIDVTPRYVLAPPDLETIMEQALSEVQATSTSEVNPFAALSLVIEPRLTSASQWYVTADPALIDGLEYAYLAGAPGPQLDQQLGFDIDGIRFRVRLDFGAGWVDHRGWYRVGA